jgi:hypothetical protein
VKFSVAALTVRFAGTAAAQKLTVRVVNRRDSETDYSDVVPGHFNAHSNADVNCYGSSCNGLETTNGSITPAHQVSYHARGATFSLQSPDGATPVIALRTSHALSDLNTASG